MSVAAYWKERLEERRPIRLDAYYVEGFDWRPHPTGGTWPRLLASSAFYKDYCAWHEDVYLAAYRGSPYFQDFPDQMPQVLDEGSFWNTFGPFVYLNRKHQRRGHYVWGQRKHEDEWVKCRVHRYFIRMATWEECLAQYSLLTGGTPSDPTACVDLIGGAMRRMQAQGAAAKARLPEGMRNPD